MKRTQLSVAVLALAAGLALAGCKKNENTNPDPVPAPSAPAPAATPAPAAPAVSVQGVSIGNAAGADKNVVAMSSFNATDPIIVSVRTQGTASNVPLTARLTYQDGQVAGEQSVTLNTSGPDVTNVTFSNANPWPVGTYTVDVTVDGQPAGLAQQIQVR